MTDIITVVIHCPDAASATMIAEAVRARRLAAAANIDAPMTSLYTWAGKAERAPETRLHLKTRAALFDPLATLIRALHPYELPCVIGHPISHATPEYRAWVLSETEGGA